MESKYLGKLAVTLEGESEHFVDIPERMTIGRSSKNTLVIPRPDVSRKHAEIRMFRPGRYFLFENQSRNGTFLNDVRVVGSQELSDGDTILIGKAALRFVAPPLSSPSEITSQSSDATPTALGLADCTVVVLMSDIRDYTELTAKLPSKTFQTFVADWFKAVIGIVEGHSGTIDRIAGDAIMVYWVARDPLNPSPEVKSGIETARDMVALMKERNHAFSELFADHGFRIGVGLNAGHAAKVNFGDRGHQAFTVVGNCVNLTARLESLTKTENRLVIAGEEIARWAPAGTEFADLGEVVVRGRAEPLRILALDVEGEL